MRFAKLIECPFKMFSSQVRLKEVKSQNHQTAGSKVGETLDTTVLELRGLQKAIQKRQFSATQMPMV